MKSGYWCTVFLHSGYVRLATSHLFISKEMLHSPTALDAHAINPRCNNLKLRRADEMTKLKHVCVVNHRPKDTHVGVSTTCPRSLRGSETASSRTRITQGNTNWGIPSTEIPEFWGRGNHRFVHSNCLECIFRVRP